MDGRDPADSRAQRCTELQIAREARDLACVPIG